MSEHMFGGSETRRVSQIEGKAIDAVAKRHGATFVWARMPEGYKSWFVCRNYGDPFNGATEHAVFSELRALGLADNAGLILRGK